MNFIEKGKEWLYKTFGSGTDFYTQELFSRYQKAFLAGQADWDTLDKSPALIYESTGVVANIIRKKANMKAAGIWKHYDRNGDVIKNSPIVEFLKKPNPLTSGQDFLKEFETYRCIWGGVFIKKVQGTFLSETPSALWNVLPSEITIDITGNIYSSTKIEEIINGFIYNQGGKNEFTYEPNEILYLRTVNPSHPIFPVSPFKHLHMEITNIRKAMAYRNVVLDKKGAIGILSSETKGNDGGIALTGSERQRIEKQYQSDYGLSRKQMQIIITQANVKWQAMGYPTKEMMLFEEVESNSNKIIDNYGLNTDLFTRDKPTSLGGESGSKMLQGLRTAYETTIIPESKNDSQAITSYLGADRNGGYLELDYSHLPALKEDGLNNASIQKIKAETVAIMIENGRSLEEAEEMANVTYGTNA